MRGSRLGAMPSSFARLALLLALSASPRLLAATLAPPPPPPPPPPPAAAAAASAYTTLVGAPELVGGPTCCMFDSPFLGLRTATGAVGITANSDTYVFALGASVSDTLPSPLATGLHADADNSSYSFCGKWLNAAFVDPANASVVHGFFHQEWHCDYAMGLYTNKSVGYARSEDGGLTFAPAGENVQLIAGNNFSSTRQCGEGDHGVVRLGDFLYLFFIEWDGPESIHGGTTAALARSAVADRGVPGSWRKWWGGSFEEPGVGGRSDVVWVPGTAVYAVPAAAADALIAVGVIFSGPLDVSWSGGDGSAAAPTDWAPAAAGPLFNFGWSDWNRVNTSAELIGYPGLASDAGSPDGALSGTMWVYFTYLAPGDTFERRWLVRRPLRIMRSATATTGAHPGSRAAAAAPPTALSALSVWASTTLAGGTRFWAAGGPVTPSTPGNFTLSLRVPGAQPAFAYLATSAAAAGLIEVVECVPAGGLRGGVVALAAAGECGRAGGAFASGTPLRTPGWAAPTAAAAEALDWARVADVGGSGAALGATAAQLWRCIGAGEWNFSAALGGDCGAAGAGFAEDALLGYALSPLAPLGD